MLDSGGGTPAEFPIDLRLDLDDGRMSGSWTLPGGTAQTPHFELQVTKTVDPSPRIFFAGETASDDAVYSLVLTLL